MSDSLSFNSYTMSLFAVVLCYALQKADFLFIPLVTTKEEILTDALQVVIIFPVCIPTIHADTAY